MNALSDDAANVFFFKPDFHTTMHAAAQPAWVTDFAATGVVEKRGKASDRRRVTRNGRRATDVHPLDRAHEEMARELSGLKKAMQVVLDALQELTGSRKKL